MRSLFAITTAVACAAALIHCGGSGEPAAEPPADAAPVEAAPAPRVDAGAACQNLGRIDLRTAFTFADPRILARTDGPIVYAATGFASDYGYSVSRIRLPFDPSAPRTLIEGTVAFETSRGPLAAIAYEPASRTVAMLHAFGAGYKVGTYTLRFVSADDPAWLNARAKPQETILEGPGVDAGSPEAYVLPFGSAAFIGAKLVVAGAFEDKGDDGGSVMRAVAIVFGIGTALGETKPIVERRMFSFRQVVLAGDGAWLVGRTVEGRAGLLRIDSAGDVDRTFGVDGLVSVGQEQTAAVKAAVDGSGRIVLVRLLDSDATNVVEAPRPILTRLLPSGVVDTTYGAGGTMEVPLIPPYAAALDVAVERGGAAFVGGIAPLSGELAPIGRPVAHAAFARIDGNGKPDTSFAGADGGLAIVPPRGAEEEYQGWRSAPGALFLQDPSRAPCDEALVAVFGPVQGELDPTPAAYLYR